MIIYRNINNDDNDNNKMKYICAPTRNLNRTGDISLH